MQHAYQKGDEPVPGAGYRLVGFLGRGGFGEVWKATTPGGAEAAVKIIRLGGAEGRKEFRALQLVKRVRHPNLMPVAAFWLKGADGRVIEEAGFAQTELLGPETAPGSLDTGLPAETVFAPPAPAELVIIMGLGDKSLNDRLEECRSQGSPGIPAEELLGYLEDAGEAIDFLNSPVHDQGAGPVAIQHCDIKPHNLMIVGGAVQVCDFGLARMMGVERVTTGAASIAYAAPELLDKNKVSPSTDQYSLAITYYELRSGRLPYSGETISAALDAKHDDAYDFSGCPAAEQDVLRRAAARDPAKRFPSAMAMIKALRQAATSVAEGEAAGVPGPAQRRRPTLSGVFTTLGALSLLAILSLAGWALFRSAPQAPASAEDLLERGTASLEEGHYDRAIDDFTQAALQAPRDVRPLSRRGTAWFRKKEYQKAADDLSEAIRIDPDPRDYVTRGRSYQAIERAPQAIADFDAAIRLDPACAAAFFYRGDYHLKHERNEEAVSDLTEAIQRFPQGPDAAFSLADAHTLRGSAYLLQGQAAEAIQDFSMAIRLEPKDRPAVHQLRASAHELAGRAALAKSDARIAELLKKVEAGPDEAATLRELALLLATHPEADLRDGPKAVELATRACKLTADKDAAALDALAAACAETGRFDDAASAARMAVERAPDAQAAKTYRDRLSACENRTTLRADAKR